jgi:hypothetical protein
MAKPKTSIPSPLPATGTIPEAGKIFFNAGRERSYRLAKSGAIPVLETGTRGKLALLHVLARRLGIDPNDLQG